MTRRTRIWLFAAGLFLVFVIAAWLLGRLLELGGADLWVLRIGLVMLGFAAAGVVVWFFLMHGAPATGEAKAEDIDAMMAAARAHLASSKVAGTSSMAGLPMLLVLGPTGSAKTTTITRSGLDPELLAGAVTTGEAVAPTRGINVWYAQRTIFVEAGGPLETAPARFARVLRHARQRRLGAVLAGKPQPPRRAVVCVSCEELIKPSASESLMTHARELRARLVETSKTLGIRLPVYVVFTKTDRVPHFTEYVQTLTTDEARQVLGATLPAELGGAGLYADRETARVGDAFQRIFLSLADHRLPFLSRQHAAEPKPSIYEFPREFRKLAPLVTQFLVELCKPSQLQVSPFLRGFYFTGVRPVLVQDSAGSSTLPPTRAAGAAAMPRRATGVFRHGEVAAAQPVGAYAPPSTRKVPQWVFLGRLFEDVLLGDEAAMRATTGGAAVNLLRRTLVLCALAAAAVLAVGIGISYAGNSALQRETNDAARAFAALPASDAAVPSVDALRRLDSLRQRLVLLRSYSRDGAPLHLRWGLYDGDALYAAARPIYFAALDKLLLGGTRTSLGSTLQALPDAPRPTDDYGATYALLKAYLITTNESKRSTSAFLEPVLFDRWSAGKQVDPERQQLVKQQLVFYADELPAGNPYPGEADAATVQRARHFLLGFAGSERIYQNILSEAAKTSQPVSFNARFPGSAAYVVDRYEVPGAFTKSGYAFVQGALRNVDKFFQGESWVLGEQRDAQVDRAQVVSQLANRYVTDYLHHWKNYLQSASVVRYAGAKDAAKKLAALSGPQSPLLAMLSLAAQNTAVDTGLIGKTMQPVAAVVSPATPDKYIGESNQGYMTALATLQASLDQLGSAPAGGSDAIVQQTTANASTATLEARKLAQSFRAGGDPTIGPTVLSLLLAPISYTDPLLRNFGAGEMNPKGEAFCAKARPVLAKYPFNPSADAQASSAEVAQMFQPGTGALWQLYNDGLQNVLQKNGNEYQMKPGATPALSPAFVTFFNRAASVSDVLFRDGGAEPRLAVSLKPIIAPGIKEVAVSIEGQTARWDKKQLTPKQFAWTGNASGDASVTIKLDSGTDLRVLTYTGPWALFKLFGDADSWQSLGPTSTVEWLVRTGGQPLTLQDGTPVKVAFEVNLGGLPPVLRKNYFANLSCVSKMAQ